MKHLKKSLLTAAVVMASGVAQAAPYNHGNHNDPQVLFGTNSVNTISCGSMSLSSCISAINLEAIAAQLCRNKVVDDTDGLLPWGQAYFHTVQQYALHVISAIDNSPGVNNYSVDLEYSCSGYKHPGIVYEYSKG